MRLYIMRVTDKVGNYYFTVAQRNDNGTYTHLGTANHIIDGEALKRKHCESK